MIELIHHDVIQMEIVAFTVPERGWAMPYIKALGLAGTLYGNANKMAVQPCPIDDSVNSETFDTKVQEPVFDEIYAYFEASGITIANKEADALHITENARATALGRALVTAAEKQKVRVIEIPNDLSEDLDMSQETMEVVG